MSGGQDWAAEVIDRATPISANVVGCVPLSNGSVYNTQTPEVHEVPLASITLSLSRIARFGGQTSETYRVLQHAVLCANAGPTRLRRALLCHDHAEGITGIDMTSPVKAMFPAYKAFEDRIQNAIFAGLCIELSVSDRTEIKRIDHSVCRAEAEKWMVSGDRWKWPEDVTAAPINWDAIGGAWDADTCRRRWWALWGGVRTVDFRGYTEFTEEPKP